MDGHCTGKAQSQVEDLVIYLENKNEQHKTKYEGGTPNDSSKCKSQNDITTFLDLPPEIIEKVFTYLPATEVYCYVRNVCHRLRELVNGYIQAGKHTK